MRIVIVGGGVVGYSLSQQLLKENHHISLIEPDGDVAEEIANKMDLLVVNASGSSPDALETAGITEADMVIAVTPLDEVNLVVCGMARQYGVARRIARLRSREFISTDRKINLDDLGVTDFIFPEMVVVDAIHQYIETPGATDAINFENGRILMRGFKMRNGMPVVGKTLIQIRSMMESEVFLIAAVIRGDRGIIPPGDFVIEAGDYIHCLFPRSAVDSFMRLINESMSSIKRVVLTGDNLSTRELAATLQDSIPSVTLVEPDLERAHEVAAVLAKTDVIHGDCTEIDVLRDVDINRADFFVASSNEADYNMMSALLAKQEGAREVVAVSTEYQHDRLFQSLGIDHVINPRITAAREIMQIISRGHFGTVVHLGDAEIDAVRLTVEENSRAVGVPLTKLWKKLRKGALVGIIARGDKMIIPGGDTTFQPNDHVITIAYTKYISAVRKLFKGSHSDNL